ncbi:MAG: glycoside hydrolase family 9 protein [Clostridia bacterium]|nr:glycoside hydrolase family 9 protein [Clostridia bacterium]
MELQNAIKVNHRGFLCNSKKRFILTENKNGSLDFSVYLIHDVKHICVYRGQMVEYKENGQAIYEGDFSSVCDNGDYFIEAGGYISRHFVIYDGAYDICQRTMLQYFTYQRCGNPLGWAGKCHLDDGYIKETGEHIDLSGGYHQSSDLRKSPGGVSIGVNGMLRFALSDKSQWGAILVKDEVRWALDYYLKTIQNNGVMYNTLNDPFGWEGRVFYKSGAPSSSQWNITSILVMGYMYFKDTDFDYAKKCLDTALRSYNYLMSEERSSEVYKHPDKYQMGMDPDFFFEQCRKNSTSDLCYQISASSDLYKATGEDKYLEHIKKCLPLVLDKLYEFSLLRTDDTEKSVMASCSYCWLMSGLLSLCDAYELLGDYCDIKNSLLNALNGLCVYMDKSIWKYAEKVYLNKDLDVIDGHENKTRRQYMRNLNKFGNCYYNDDEIFEPSIALYFGLFLVRCGKLLNDNKYIEYAQVIVDNLLGVNELDSSHIYAIGFNHARQHAYGQFFPSTPYIPGAIGVGYGTLDVYTSGSEYDMPCVGLAMYLISEITNK